MIALFLLKLCAGITLMWLLMPRQDVTDGFFRIQMRVVLGLAVLTALLISTPDSTPEAELAPRFNVTTVARSFAIVLAAVTYVGSVLWALGRRGPGNVVVYVSVLLAAGALALHSVYGPRTVTTAQQVLADFSTAAVAGSVLTGMLLGHWYLTTPTMSIKPLWWFNSAIAVAALLRMVASGWAILNFGLPEGDVSLQIWFSMRWLGGIVAPVAVAVMVWRILKLRNTQSATGVLFAGLILVFMGEMTAALLEQHTHIPY